MKLSACITTRNRTSELENCLTALWKSTVLPFSVIVSDDSAEESVQKSNREVVDRYPGTTYILGPRNGVCGNRNNAVNAVQGADLVAFIDDDIYVEPNFIEVAIQAYQKIDVSLQSKTIISGSSIDQYGQKMRPSRLSFRGYFEPHKMSEVAHWETVAIHATVFPRTLFHHEVWDENIYFGYEDGELCLRALKEGYKIYFEPDLKVFHACYDQGTLGTPQDTILSNYEVYTEAARLYVGIKRYKDIFPNIFKLCMFLIIYFPHMTLYLLRRQSIISFPEIIRRSQWKVLFTN
jgi:GT2 family glycosyltransferase